MKKSPIFLFATASVALMISFTACKKDNQKDTDPAFEYTTHSDDQSRVSGEMDAIANDADVAIESEVAFNGRQAVLIADATVVLDSTNDVRRLTITYNGSANGTNRTRTGVVVLSMPLDKRWKDEGAVLTVSYQNVKATRVSDNKSVTLNGTSTITNVSGGKLSQLASMGSITHTIASPGMTITFDNNQQRVWQVAKKRVYTYNNGIVVAITGTHSDGTMENIAEWGVNRLGHDFFTAIEQPLIVKQDCNFRLTSGKVVYNNLLAITFGLDEFGVPTSCPQQGHFFYKAEWSNLRGQLQSIILPY